MTNQITSSSIVFLQEPLTDYSKNLVDNMIKVWQENNKILKIIESKGTYDENAVNQLINEVMMSKDQPINILIDHDIINMPLYNLLWSVLGTLSAARLIKIITYQWCYFEIAFENFSNPPHQFLYKAADYFENFSVFSSWRNKNNT